MSASYLPNSGSNLFGDSNILESLFGPKTCTDYWGSFFMQLLLAVLLTFIFALLAYVPVDRYMAQVVGNPNQRLMAKGLLFFLLAWLLSWLFMTWGQNHPQCPGQNR